MRPGFRPVVEGMETRVLAARGCRWRSPVIAYHESMELPGFSRAEVQAAYDAAWADWARVANIHPVRVDDPAAANVVAVAEPMDPGGLGTRGASEIPCAPGPDGQVTIRINTLVSHDARSLDSVLTHEVGHSLGLFHSNKGDSIMWSAYNGITDLRPADVKAIRKLYGARII